MFFRRAISQGGSSKIMPRGCATSPTPFGAWLFVSCCLCCLCAGGGSGSSGGALAAPVVAAAAAGAATEQSLRTHTPETYDSTLRRRRQQPLLNDINGQMRLESDRTHLQSALRKLGLWLLEQAEDLQEAAARPYNLDGAYRQKSSGVGQEQSEAMHDVLSENQDVASEWQDTRVDEDLVVPRPWKKNFVKISNIKWSKSPGGADY